nr:MAG TPA: hypothetical protein [Caudoviricetes sp.]
MSLSKWTNSLSSYICETPFIFKYFSVFNRLNTCYFVNSNIQGITVRGMIYKSYNKKMYWI